METFDLKDVVQNFQVEGEYLSSRPMGLGHINNTFLVEVNNSKVVERYTIQRINHHIFRHPELMMVNFEKIASHIRERLLRVPGSCPEREAINLLKSKSGKNFYLSPQGNYWRGYRFVDNSHTIEVAENPDQAYQAGQAFGCFLKLLSDISVADLHETIPFFHHTPRRFARFLKALEKDVYSRAAGAKDVVDLALARKAMVSVITDALEDGSLPLRVTHNDTKINNVLFDDRTGKAVCVIDLDTTMPGSALYDFGDMMRTTTHFIAEDEKNLTKVKMEMGMFRTLARGYLEEVRDFLTERELALLVFSGRLITFTIGIRFLTDYLEGDVYFKTHRSGQNLDRARVQFALVKSMEDQQEEMEKVIQDILGRK